MRQLRITNSITSRESLALEKYLSEIGKIPMLRPDEEVLLAQRIREGDQNALDKMTRANLRFVVSVAKQYQNQGLSLNDLINEGNVGLIKAAKRFDEKMGFKFISYAVWWIRQSILKALVEHSRLVRLPLNKVAAYNKINQEYTRAMQQLEREPTHEELAEIMDVSPDEVRDVLKGSRYVSLDAPLGSDEDEGTLLDTRSSEDGSPDEALMRESNRQEVLLGLQHLSPREQQVIRAYFGLDGSGARTLDEISEMYDLTRERTRQLKERALRRLRRTYNPGLLGNG